jgi:hypothetical protein
MTNAEARPARGRPSRGKGAPVMLRLPDDIMGPLSAMAEQRSIPVATLARQLLKERLDQIQQGSGQ